jgi:hypothetical protein
MKKGPAPTKLKDPRTDKEIIAGASN